MSGFYDTGIEVSVEDWNKYGLAVCFTNRKDPNYTVDFDTLFKYYLEQENMNVFTQEDNEYLNSPEGHKQVAISLLEGLSILMQLGKVGYRQ